MWQLSRAAGGFKAPLLPFTQISARRLWLFRKNIRQQLRHVKVTLHSAKFSVDRNGHAGYIADSIGSKLVSATLSKHPPRTLSLRLFKAYFIKCVPPVTDACGIEGHAVQQGQIQEVPHAASLQSGVQQRRRGAPRDRPPTCSVHRASRHESAEAWHRL
jgi:hypothetical protein